MGWQFLTFLVATTIQFWQLVLRWDVKVILISNSLLSTGLVLLWGLLPQFSSTHCSKTPLESRPRKRPRKNKIDELENLLEFLEYISRNIKLEKKKIPYNNATNLPIYLTTKYVYSPPLPPVMRTTLLKYLKVMFIEKK